ncbi:MAG TPA: glycosyltransferase family 2 protein [bacterium]|nr:glycosyltransferase family 2 protein [bacterium]
MKLSIAFITYNNNSLKYLPFFLPSLFSTINQAKSNLVDLDIDILIVDNSDTSFTGNFDFLSNAFSDKKYDYKIWRSSSNLGFAKAYNLMLNWSLQNKSDLFLVINPDVVFDDLFLEKLIMAHKLDNNIAVWVPKILYWNFNLNKKTDIIDSYGLGLNKFHHFFDLGQGKKQLQYLVENNREVFGFTGAGALFNLSQILISANLVGDYLEFFDELMFMYKEDIDLSYRLQLAGKKIIFLPEAIMYHDRTLSKKNIFKKIFDKEKKISNSRSFLNQLIILYKIKKIPFSFVVRFSTKFRLIFLYIYGFLFEKQSLNNFKKIRSQIKENNTNLSINREIITKIETFMKGLDL